MDHSEVEDEVDVEVDVDDVDVDEVVGEDALEADAPADDASAMADVENSDAAERLRGLIVYLATNLVDDPGAVEVEARQRGGSVFVSLRVPEEELGKVIGRGGRIARAMRTALMISGSRSNVRASLDIED